METNENKLSPKLEKENQKQKKLSDIDASEKEELKPFMVEISAISNNKDKTGYTIKKEWDGMGVKSDDLKKVEKIIEKYNTQRNYVINGEGIIKKIDDKLGKIKKDKILIVNRTKELLEKGFTEDQAITVAELEDKIRCDKERADLLSESIETSNFVDKKIKDANKRLEQAQKNIETDNKILNDLINGPQQKTPSNDTEKTKSKRQLIRDAGETLRNVKLDVSLVEQTKQDLINQKYKPEDAEKIATLIAEISADEKRAEIIKQNPKIENGLKELKKIEERINENVTKRDNLLTNSEKTSEPEKPKTGVENSKYPFKWTVEKNDGSLKYEYEEGEYTFEIRGEETRVFISEDKSEWKPSKIKKILTVGLSNAGKEVFLKEPRWKVFVLTEQKNGEISGLEKEYSDSYKFKTKAEAIAFADKIIDRGMEIKHEEESKYMPQQGNQEAEENIPNKSIEKRKNEIEENRKNELLGVEEPGMINYQNGMTVKNPNNGNKYKIIEDPVDHGEYYLVKAEDLSDGNKIIQLKLNKNNTEKIKEINEKYNAELALLENQNAPENPEEGVENLVSMKEWVDFVDNNYVAEHTINNIVEKIRNNQKLSDKEEKIRQARVQLIEEKLKSSDIKQDMRNAENKRISNLTPEQMLGRLAFIEKTRKEKLESSFKGKIINGLDKWEKYGQGEAGPKGFAKRMTKSAVNLALIGVISSVAVDQLAEAGIGSATALGGGVFSYAFKKLVIGLGFGAAFDRIGSKLPASDNKKFAETTKKVMPYLVGFGSTIAATLMSGGIVGAAAGAGFLVSKFVKGFFTKEKIEAREEKSKEKLLAEIRAKGGAINEKDEERYEMEMEKIIKKFENQKIWGRLVDGVTKLTIASTVSAITLEASGIAQDHLQHNQAPEEAKSINKDENTNQQSTDKVQENQNAPETQKAEADTTNAVKPTTPTTENTNTPETNTNMDDMIIHKGEGIENSFIRQIEHNHELAKELGYKGDLDDTKALHEFAGHQAHVIATEEGYVDGHGGEVRVAEADKVGYEIKTENGHVSVVERNATGDVIEVHHEGDKFEENIDKNEYIKNNSEINSDHSGAQTEGTHRAEDSSKFNVPEEVNRETGEKIDVKNIQETPHVEDGNKFTPPEETKINESSDNTTNDGAKTENIQTTNQIIHNELTQIQLEEVHKVFDNNIDHLFHEKPYGSWEAIQNRISAERIFELAQKNEISSDFKPLVEYMGKLESLTEIHPYTKDLIHPDGPETIPHFMGRALEEAYRKGILDKVKL